MGKCFAGLLLTRTVNHRRRQPTLVRTYAYAGLARPAIEAQTLAVNSLNGQSYMSGAAGVVVILAASPPHKFSFRPNLNLGTHTEQSFPNQLAPIRPYARPGLSCGPRCHRGFPSHTSSCCPLQVSKQAAYHVCIGPLLFVPTRVEAASTTHTRLVMTAACLGFDGQANPSRRRSSYGWHIAALPTCSTWQREYDE